MFRKLRCQSFRLFKYFLVLLIFAFTSLLLRDKEDDFKYVPSSLFNFSKDDLDPNLEYCFLYDYWKETYKSNNWSSPLSRPANDNWKMEISPLFQAMFDFSMIAESHGIELVLLEPSILFCILSALRKKLLLERNFTVSVREEDTISMAVLAKHVPILRQNLTLDEISSKNLKVEFLEEAVEGWMKEQNPFLYKDKKYTSHVFCRRSNWTIHLIVLHERSNFLWHAAVPSHRGSTHGYFTDKDSAYEKFSVIPLHVQKHFIANISIPSNIHHFLFELETAEFIECNSTISANFAASTSPENTLISSAFRRRSVAAIIELKHKLYPHHLRFWIWSGTMLGWYRQCDLIPYTSDVDFAAWASDVRNLDDIVSEFTEGNHLKIRQRMGMIETGLEFNLNCHGLRVDLFFMYLEANGTWYAGHRPSKKYYFKYHHPNFKLCSVELLGEKVLAPCSTEEVIVTEYGHKWMEPVTSWNYEWSIWNRGPNIYWNEEELKKVNVDYS